MFFFFGSLFLFASALETKRKSEHPQINNKIYAIKFLIFDLPGGKMHKSKRSKTVIKKCNKFDKNQKKISNFIF